jgi:hypothetical protein
MCVAHVYLFYMCCGIHAGKTQLIQRYLMKEYLMVQQLLMQKLHQANNITMAVDGWTNASKKSVMACNVMTPTSRSVDLLGVRDLTTVKHDAQQLASKLVNATENSANHRGCSKAVT